MQSSGKKWKWEKDEQVFLTIDGEKRNAVDFERWCRRATEQQQVTHTSLPTSTVQKKIAFFRCLRLIKYLRANLHLENECVENIHRVFSLQALQILQKKKI